MGSANSSQRQQAHQAFKNEFKAMANIARILEDEDMAKRLEDLSESPDIFADKVALRVRKCLAGRQNKTLGAPKRKASGDVNGRAPKRKAPDAREEALLQHLKLFQLSQPQVDRLVSLVREWEFGQEVIVQNVAQNAPRWEKEPRLFWGEYSEPVTASTAVAKVKHLFHKIEEFDTISPVRRRLSLVIIHEIVESEIKLLTSRIEELYDKDNRYTTTVKQRREIESWAPLGSEALDNRLREVQRLLGVEKLLDEGRTHLRNQIEQYPLENTVRLRVFQKLTDDLWGIEIPEEERKKKRDKLVEYARWGEKYRQLRPRFIIFLLGNKNASVYEREQWSDEDHNAVESYWQNLSGIYDTCLSYSPLIESLKQGYWDLLPTKLVTKGAELPDLPSGSSPLGGALPEGQHNHTEVPHTPSLSASQTQHPCQGSENFTVPQAEEYDPDNGSQPGPSFIRHIGGTIGIDSLPEEYAERPASDSLAPPSSAENFRTSANTGHEGGLYAPSENEPSRTDIDSLAASLVEQDELPPFDLNSFFGSVGTRGIDSFLGDICATWRDNDVYV